MVDVLEIIRNVVIICGIGGAGMWLWWLKTRQPKQTYMARVYQLSGAERKIKGTEPRIEDLRPHIIDVIDKIEQNKQTVYRLQKLNLPVPAVEESFVEEWQGKKWVDVLVQNGQATLLDKGYDLKSAETRFKPIPVDDTNMIIQQSQMRKERNQQEKGLLQAVLPWVGVGIMVIGTVLSVYILMDGMKEINEVNAIAQVTTSENNKEFSDTFLESVRLLRGAEQKDIIVPQPGEQDKPPSVEPKLE